MADRVEEEARAEEVEMEQDAAALLGLLGKFDSSLEKYQREMRKYIDAVDEAHRQSQAAKDLSD